MPKKAFVSCEQSHSEATKSGQNIGANNRQFSNDTPIVAMNFELCFELTTNLL